MPKAAACTRRHEFVVPRAPACYDSCAAAVSSSISDTKFDVVTSMMVQQRQPEATMQHAQKLRTLLAIVHIAAKRRRRIGWPCELHT